jgi:dihydrofolate reductase
MGVSLDGYMEAADGTIDIVTPDDEIMAFHNSQSQDLDLHLTGRRLYETMLPWELDQSMRSGLLSTAFAEIWTSIPKLVFSRTLTEVQGNAALATRPVAEELADLRAANDAQTISVGGANLAAELAHHDLIDEYRLFVNPVIVGAGTRFFPPLRDRLALELDDQVTFKSGVLYLAYRRTR